MGKIKEQNTLSVKRYTQQEINELFDEYLKTNKQSEIIRNKLIEAHMPLVESIRRQEDISLGRLRRYFIIKSRNFRKEDIIYYHNDKKQEKEFIEKKTDDYNDYYKDYEGYTEEEFEDRGIGFK